MSDWTDELKTMVEANDDSVGYIDLDELRSVPYRESVSHIGYHFTSLDNWHKIQRQGLRPHMIDKPELKPFFPEPVDGIWIWREGLSPRNEMESVLFQCAEKATSQVVLLKVLYHYWDQLFYWDEDGKCKRIVLTHEGVFGNYEFHIDGPEAVILKAPVLPENIELVREYDLMDLVKEPVKPWH